ncbi:hypothetical protein NMY22_g6702 [Coprinellus aureogranulatus]|nr:hypothetical protein NMY22_g6702 [Coprinellus aureogranulatus]
MVVRRKTRGNLGLRRITPLALFMFGEGFWAQPEDGLTPNILTLSSSTTPCRGDYHIAPLGESRWFNLSFSVLFAQQHNGPDMHYHFSPEMLFVGALSVTTTDPLDGQIQDG